MHFLRKSLVGLLSSLFIVLLFTTAIDVGFVRIGTHPATIKSILAKSGIYNSVVPGLLDQAKTITSSGGDVSLSNPVVRSAATATFTPEFVQQNTNQVIDGTYDWLDGKTPVPDFQIDLTSAKIAFANNVAAAAQKQLAALPVCTTAQTEAMGANFDPLSVNCLPKGTTAASAASTLQSNILSGKGFLDNPVITADSIKNRDNGQPVFTSKNVKQVPSHYQRAKKTPMILGVVTVLVGLAIIFVSSSRRAGLRHVGIPLLVIGLLLLAFAWGLNRVTAKTVAPKIDVNNAVLQSSLRTLLVDVEQAVDKSYWWFGGSYAALGVAALSGSMFFKRNQKQVIAAATETAGPAPEPPVHDSAPEPKAKPEPKPKTNEPDKPKAPRKIEVK